MQSSQENICVGKNSVTDILFAKKSTLNIDVKMYATKIR